jgi:hypothetical protein
MGIAQNTAALATSAQINPAFLYDIDMKFSLYVLPLHVKKLARISATAVDQNQRPGAFQ